MDRREGIRRRVRRRRVRSDRLRGRDKAEHQTGGGEVSGLPDYAPKSTGRLTMGVGVLRVASSVTPPRGKIMD